MSDWRKAIAAEGLEVLAELAFESGSLVLIGNAGSGFWKRFAASVEYSDGNPNPLDRWSRSVGTRVARIADAEPVFPFEGPPWPAFPSWSAASGRSFVSPLGLQVHIEYGLWHAHRFALKFARRTPAEFIVSDSPCLSCEDQPCLQACPVDAFDGNTYHVNQCLGHLSQSEEVTCMREGCLARHACPVGQAIRYEPQHAAFHMQAFVQSQLNSTGAEE